MPDYDMSDRACQARAKHQREHDKALKDINELFERVYALLNLIMSVHPEIADEFKEWMKPHKEH